MEIPFLPASASGAASELDRLFLALFATSLVVGCVVLLVVLYVSVRYRARPGVVAEHDTGPRAVPVLGLVLSLAAVVALVLWSGRIAMAAPESPDRTLDVRITAKQWMWDVRYPEGQRELNDLHVPVDVPVRLELNSEDVVHSLHIPALRVAQDILPGRTTWTRFEATRPGQYHLFCAEFCGPFHSRMVGTVHVLEEVDYDRWLSGSSEGSTPEEAGKLLFQALRCDGCHNATAAASAPDLAGQFGGMAELEGGQSVTFDEAYVRESLLDPKAQVVAGYQPVMSSYQGQLSDEQIAQLTAYLKSLK